MCQLKMLHVFLYIFQLLGKHPTDKNDFFLSFSCIFPPRVELGTGHMAVTDCAQTRQNFSGPLFQDDGQGGISESRLPPTGDLQEEVSSADGGAIGVKGRGASVWTVSLPRQLTI